MSKYEPLLDHLKELDRRLEHSMDFREIEAVLGYSLPASARTYQAWWANQKNGRHVQANAWLDAGWHTENLDLKAERVTFRAVGLPRSPRLTPPPDDQLRPMTIAEAKQAVAMHFGVLPGDVKITVSG